jgi:hypothetical protein
MAGQWYIARVKQKLGPFSFEELQELASTLGLLPTEMVLQDGAPKWRSASEVEGLFWGIAEDRLQSASLPPSPTNLTASSPAPAKSEDTAQAIPVPSAPTNPAPALAPSHPEAVDSWEGPSEASAPPRAPPAVPSPAEATDWVEAVLLPSPEPPLTDPLPTEPSLANPPPGTSGKAVPGGDDNTDRVDVGRLTTTPSAALPAPAQPESHPARLFPREEGKAPAEPPTSANPARQESRLPETGPPGTGSEKVDDRREPSKAGRTVFKWVAGAAVMATLLGLTGDFLRPLASFNLFAFLATSGLLVVLVVLRGKRGAVLGSYFWPVCASSITLALGFGVWWGLAHFKGSREKGYLAEHSRFVGRLQSAILTKDEREVLSGVWVLGSDDPAVAPDSELRMEDGRLNWRIQFPKRGSFVRIEAKYGVTTDGVVYGVITRIDSSTTGTKLLPEEDDTFSFRFRTNDNVLLVRELRGSGFDELKKVVQGRYKRRE